MAILSRFLKKRHYLDIKSYPKLQEIINEDNSLLVYSSLDIKNIGAYYLIKDVTIEFKKKCGIV